MRLFYSFFLIPFSIYLTAVGGLLAEKGIHQYLPAVFIPYFKILTRMAFFKLGHWYDQAFIWWTMVVGIPLIIIGTSLFLINFFNLYYSLFSKRYNQTHCPLCKN